MKEQIPYEIMPETKGEGCIVGMIFLTIFLGNFNYTLTNKLLSFYIENKQDSSAITYLLYNQAILIVTIFTIIPDLLISQKILARYKVHKQATLAN